MGSVSTSSVLFMAILMVLLGDKYKALGGDVGINYGRHGSNIPSPTSVSNFLTNELNYSISLIRIGDANPEVLQALSGTNLVVSVTVPNDDVPALATTLDNALVWVNLHVKPFADLVRFRYISVGTGLIPSPIATLIPPALKNLHDALTSLGLTEDIHVTTAVPIHALSKSFPPSAGEFSAEVNSVMTDISRFLYSIGSPLMINVFPYFSLVSEPENISLDYALFRSKVAVVEDNGHKYYNLFDAMVDAFGAAVARAIGKDGLRLVVGETGWPSGGETGFACVENAREFNGNLIRHAREVGRTPRLGAINMEAYVLGMFDEDLIPAPAMRRLGTFYPNLTEVYPLWKS